MVLPAKIFEIKGDADFGFMVKRLEGFSESEPSQTDGEEPLDLVTEILDLERTENTITGIFSRDFLRIRQYRRNILKAPTTEEAPFWITALGDRTFLIVLAPSVARGVKKLLTNHVANKLSDIVFGTPGAIVEVKVSNETLRELHESNPEATKLIWFDNVDIPSVEKLCLAGSSLADTGLYREYLEHGMIWYVVFEARKRGVVVGITRNCVVTLFSKSTVEEFVKYVVEDFLALIE